MCGPDVLEQGTPTGDLVTKCEVWNGGDCYGPKRNNLAEKHCYCGHPILKGRVQGNHRAHGWGIRSFVGGSRRDMYYPERDLKRQTCG